MDKHNLVGSVGEIAYIDFKNGYYFVWDVGEPLYEDGIDKLLEDDAINLFGTVYFAADDNSYRLRWKKTGPYKQ